MAARDRPGRRRRARPRAAPPARRPPGCRSRGGSRRGGGSAGGSSKRMASPGSASMTKKGAPSTVGSSQAAIGRGPARAAGASAARMRCSRSTSWALGGSGPGGGRRTITVRSASIDPAGHVGLAPPIRSIAESAGRAELGTVARKDVSASGSTRQARPGSAGAMHRAPTVGRSVGARCIAPVLRPSPSSSRLQPRLRLAQHPPRDRDPVHLARAVVDAERPHLAVEQAERQVRR